MAVTMQDMPARPAARRPRLLTALAGVAVLVALASSAPVQAARTANGTASATVLRAVSIAVAQNLSTGAVKTRGSSATGQVVVPATYPTLASPVPSYINADATNGANAQAPNAAQINLAGAPGQAFTLTLTGWTEVSGIAGSTADVATSTYYSPSNAPSNVSRGVFNAQGAATVYVGSTITVQRVPSGTTVVLKPSFTVTYN